MIRLGKTETYFFEILLLEKFPCLLERFILSHLKLFSSSSYFSSDMELINSVIILQGVFVLNFIDHVTMVFFTVGRQKVKTLISV